MNALLSILASKPLTITGQYWANRGEYLRVYVDLSNGQQLGLRYDRTHNYVNVTLYRDQWEEDEAGKDVAYDATGLPESEVMHLIELFAARVAETS